MSANNRILWCWLQIWPSIDIMLYTTHLLLVLVVMWYCFTQTETLRTTYTKQPMLGQRCHLYEPKYLTTLLNTGRAQCVWRCLSSDNCLVVSHNHHNNYCELSPMTCDKVLPNANFTINVYGIERSQCLRWVPSYQYDSKTAVEFLRQRNNIIVLSVGRVKDSTGLYPGKYQKTRWTVDYITKASTFVTTYSNCEVLLVDPGCMWAWIKYTGGNELPVGAFSAGYYGKDTLYVARSMFGIKWAIGYYKPSSQQGYFAHYGRLKIRRLRLQILVIMWHCNSEKEKKKQFCVPIGGLCNI